MYTSVEEGARVTGCSAVVDLGSGKGYLSQVKVFARIQGSICESTRKYL